MDLFALDIRTIILLTCIGNAVELILIILYVSLREHRGAYWHFVMAKGMQSLAWLLLGLRGTIPVILSAYVGDSVLIIGFAFEALAITTAGRSVRKWPAVYSIIAVAGVAAFWVFASTPNLWVVYATSATIAVFAPASVALFFAPTSMMRRAVACVYGIFCIVLAGRVWNSLVSPDFTLLSQNAIQAAAFTALFLQMIVSGIGFLLMLKERSQQMLAESESKYRTVIEKANEGICIIQDGVVVFVNPMVEGFLGLDRATILGRPFTDFVYPEDLEMIGSNYAKRMNDLDVPDSYTFRVVDANGDPVWVMISAARIEYGGRDAVLAMMRDINRIKILEAEKEQMIDELRTTLAEVKTLSGLLPICAWCKKVRDDKGYWTQIESYLKEHSEAQFSHSICPECMEKLTPGKGTEGD